MNLFDPQGDSTPPLDTQAAESWLEDVILDPAHPVVLFGVGWCGYCWAARDVLKQHGIPFRDIDTQTAGTEAGFSDTQVRRSLEARTGSRTVPQLFIGGKSIGGATELVSALRGGQLGQLFAEHGLQLKII